VHIHKENYYEALAHMTVLKFAICKLETGESLVIQLQSESNQGCQQCTSQSKERKLGSQHKKTGRKQKNEFCSYSSPKQIRWHQPEWERQSTLWSPWIQMLSHLETPPQTYTEIMFNTSSLRPARLTHKISPHIINSSLQRNLWEWSELTKGTNIRNLIQPVFSAVPCSSYPITHGFWEDHRKWVPFPH
jgi:hypothetical protein